MSETITTEYRGITIKFNEHREGWYSDITGYDSDKLANVKKNIDEFLKRESEFKNLDALHVSGTGAGMTLRSATITSVGKDDKTWVSFKDSGRRFAVDKRERKSLCKITPKNQGIIGRITVLQAEVQQRIEEINRLAGDMDRVFTEEQ